MGSPEDAPVESQRGDDSSIESAEETPEECGDNSRDDRVMECNGDATTVNHPLWPEIERLSMEQLKYARQEVGEGWQLLEKDGDMIMYKREKEINGLVEDPLKASHSVVGVTAFEMCHYFFQPEFRLEWEHTVQSVNVVEKIEENTLVFHQLHTRIWPAAVRDAVFWSHMRRVPNDETGISWMVCNRSLSSEHPKAPLKKGNVRAFLTVILLCETVLKKPIGNAPPTRDDVTCKITYCSAVHPGGWAPPKIVREISKLGYSKFLKTFTAYVANKCKGEPVRFS